MISYVLLAIGAFICGRTKSSIREEDSGFIISWHPLYGAVSADSPHRRNHEGLKGALYWYAKAPISLVTRLAAPTSLHESEAFEDMQEGIA